MILCCSPLLRKRIAFTQEKKALLFFFPLNHVVLFIDLIWALLVLCILKVTIFIFLYFRQRERGEIFKTSPTETELK